MAKVVFILGAGASAHAQVPLTNNFYEKGIDLLEDNKIDEEDRKYFEIIRDVYQNKIRQISSNFNFDLKNIETIFSLIEMAKLTGKFSDYKIKEIEDLSVAINKFIVRTIEKTTDLNINEQGNITSPKDYEMFIEGLLFSMKKKKPPITLCVISFNYDLALDFVLEIFNGPQLIDYCLFKQNYLNGDILSPIKLIKLHGSINWITCKNKKCKKIKTISIRDDIGFIANRVFPLEVSKKIKNFKCECGAELNDLPLIIPPTWNKTGNYNIENVWHQAVVEMSDAKNIFIVGYSLPPADLFFQYLLALGTLDIANLERFWVFDTNPEIKQKYLDLMRQDIKRKFKFHNMDFNNAILEIEKAIL